MKNYKLILVLFFLTNSLHTQNWEWVKSYNNNSGTYSTSYEPNDQDYINNIAVDVDGNIYSIDNFTNTLTLGSTVLTSAVNRRNIFVEKIAPNGDWIWAVQSGGDGSGDGTAKSIYVDDLNYTYIGIGYHNNVSFGSNSSDSYTNYDYAGLVAKFRPSGSVLWTVALNDYNPDSDVFISTVLTDSEGNVYVSGDFYRGMIVAPRRSNSIILTAMDTGLFGYARDIFVAKLSPIGNPIWAINVGSAGDDYNFKMDIDANDNLYLTGSIHNNYNDEPSIFENLTIDLIDDSKYIAKLNTDGQFSWVYPLADDGSIGWDLVVDNNGSVYCVDSNGFISKINSTGQLEWSKGIGNDSNNYGIGTALTIDSSNNIYVGGYFKETIIIGEDILISPNLPNGSPQDRTFLAKIDALGNWEYAFENNNSYIASIATSNRIRELKVVNEDEIIVTGHSFREDENGYPFSTVFRGKVNNYNHISDNNDVNISVYPLNEARPGLNASYRVVFNNVGTTQLDGNITLQYENTKLTFLNASETLDSQTSNTVKFNYSELNPSESRFIDLNFNVSISPDPEPEETLSFETTINPIAGDLTQEDNVFNFDQQVVNSYDPNDIIVVEGDEVLIEDAGEYFHYIIRFQNIGTASAINIRVTNLFDSNLDWTTFQLESSSHSLNIERVYGYEVSFVFIGINLPDSTSDEPNSHGFIAYKIKPKSDITVGEIVPNKADIYFDFNPAVTTNEVTTEIVSSLGLNDFEFSNSDLKMYPNPVTDKLFIESKEVIKSITVYSISGRLIRQTSFIGTQNKVEISTKTLSVGTYFVKINTIFGVIYKKLIKK